MMKGYLGKFVLVTVLSLLCHIPLGMVQDVIYERDRSQAVMTREISEQLSGRQHLAAPLIVVDVPLHDGAVKRTRRLVFTPEETRISGALRPEELHRGIYTIPAYTAELRIDGVFAWPDLPSSGEVFENATVTSEPQCRFFMPVRETKGLIAIPEIVWKGLGLQAEPGLDLADGYAMGQGFSAVISPGMLKEKTLVPFSLALSFQGAQALHFHPDGKNFAVDLQSAWPHPRFEGQYSPSSRKVSDQGFKSQWSVTEFSRGPVETQRPLLRWNETSFSVELIEPVDIYLQCTRAAKYGILFILLTFEFFLLFEILKGLRIHVAQYLMVGAALIIFYLLLISLSEHLGFALAYLAASVACVLLLAAYARSVTKSGGTAAVFGASLSVLYAALYIILSSEQYSLVMGSGLLFLILAATMFLTRDLDWYALEGRGDYARLFNKMRSGGEKKPEKKPRDKPEDQPPLSV